MASHLPRRGFLGAAGAAVAAGVAAKAAAAEKPGDRPGPKGIKIVGVCCSPRKGKTTAAALKVCLEAARAAGPNIEVELIELAGLRIEGALAAGVPLQAGQRDDFPKVAARLSEPRVAGIIVGSPVYFANMSSLCKAFLDRCIALRKKGFALADKVAGVVAVGGARNGGQELTIRSIQTALLCQEMIIVGDGRPSARIGATLWNKGDDISHDQFGIATARDLGRRLAQVALRVAGAAR